MLTKEVNMKNLTTIITGFIIFLLPTNGFAHGGHIEEVDGHTHSFIDLLVMSLVPAIIIAALLLLFVFAWKKLNG